MELLKLLSGSEIVAQIISFLLLLFILRKFLWKKFLQVLDERQKKIASEFQAVGDSRALVASLEAEYRAKIAGIEKEAKAKTEEAIAEGRRIADELRAGAEENSKKLLENTRASIQDELVKAKEELKGDIVDIVIKVTEKVIEEKLTEKTDRRIVEEFVEGTANS
jgi:F-type H+-transporting ATPase subunit b